MVWEYRHIGVLNLRGQAVFAETGVNAFKNLVRHNLSLGGGLYVYIL